MLSATIVILMNLCHAGRFEVNDLSLLVRRGIASLRYAIRTGEPLGR